MRWQKAWVVAAKELAEFRANRYVLFTLLFLPLLLAVLLPFAVFGPIAALAPSDTPLDLEPVTFGVLEGETVVGAVLLNVTIRDALVKDAVIRGSVVLRSVLIGVTVERSVLHEVTLQDALVRESNLFHPRELTRTSLLDSAVIGSRGEAFERTVVNLLNSFLLFFVVIPAAIPAVLASYSLVGEKTSRSLEPLLATPTTDGEILLGKALAIFLPTMAVTGLAAAVFVPLTNRVVAPLLGYAPLPTAEWVLGILLLAPLFCGLSIGANVLVSSRVSDVRASQQLGTLVVVPAILLFVGAMFGALTLGVPELLLFAGVVAAIDLAVGWLALRTFRREEILVSWR